jgi:predicted GH43/DUF377 family glycosyl hydrolase
MTLVEVTDTGCELRRDSSRVVARLFVPGGTPAESGVTPVLQRVLDLSEDDVRRSVRDLEHRFGLRHRALQTTFREHAAVMTAGHEGAAGAISDDRLLLLGAAFTQECSIEGAALCNPSAVPFTAPSAAADDDPDDGSTMFVMSVRAIGEGHRSSIGFRCGTVTAEGKVTLEAAGPFPMTAVAEPLGAAPAADSSYRTSFPATTLLSERVLWPQSPAECHGMEDARFVRFVDDDGSVTYFATYTAYDGRDIAQHLLATDDFATFHASPLAGAAAHGKGLALFPRKVGGRFAALSRSDRETNSVTFSDDMRTWASSHRIQAPARPWELLQLGNCGSPIETTDGWLVLTHGVGAMRTYSLGVLLLDLDDPTQVIAASPHPLLTPRRDHQDGYVPNVVYSCGGFAHGDVLVLPYGVADQRIAIATLSIRELLDSLTPTQ